MASRQDCTQFEDALRRLYALELKLTDQVRDFWKLFFVKLLALALTNLVLSLVNLVTNLAEPSLGQPSY